MNRRLVWAAAVLAAAALSACDDSDPDPDPALKSGRLGRGDAGPGDQLGGAVAVIGGELFVGAPGDDGAGDQAGAVFLFTDDGTEVSETGVLRAEAPVIGAQFGASVSFDGQTLAVGAPGDRGDGDATGAVHVFDRQGQELSAVAVVRPDFLAPGDRFGWSVAVAGDLLVVGAPGDDEDGDGSGALYRFRRVDGIYTPIQ